MKKSAQIFFGIASNLSIKLGRNDIVTMSSLQSHDQGISLYFYRASVLFIYF
jgi:hypothetical protein